MKNIVVSADWHCHNWSQYSSKDEHGICDRLHKFVQLARDFNEFSIKMKADFRVLAGDFTQSVVIRPHVINIEREILTIINEQPTIIIAGNHDIESKAGVSPVHSLLYTTSSMLDNLEYHASRSVIDYHGLKVAVRPWVRDELLEGTDEYNSLIASNVDLFVGHDIVSTATNNSGHQFFGGYHPRVLSSIAPMSVVGDIHKHHLFDGYHEGHQVIIPGCPIQSTYKDNHDCGFWHVEYDEVNKVVVRSTFYNIHDLHPNFYHQFIYVDSEEEITTSDPLVHHRIRSVAKPKNEDTDEEEVVDSTISYDLPTLIREVAKENKPEEISDEILETCIVELLDKVKFVDATSIKPSTIHKVVIKNFSSITEFELDFDSFDRDVVFTGPSGSGKSSVVEAIYWAITNKTTKNLPVSSIRNWYSSPSDSAEVHLYLTIDNSKYIIKRTRSVKGGSVEVLKEINGEYCSFETASMKDTDASILELLNLKEWEVFLLSYYSANGMDLYNELGKSTKTELLNKIVSSDEVAGLRETSGYSVSEYSTSLDRSQASYSTMISTFNKNAEELKSMQVIMDKQADTIAEKSRLEELLTQKKVQYDLSEIKITQYDKEVYDIMQSLPQLQTNLRIQQSNKDKEVQLTTSIQNLYDQVHSLNHSTKSICPTCSQKLSDLSLTTVITKFHTEIHNKQNELSDLHKVYKDSLLQQCTVAIDDAHRKLKELEDKKVAEVSLQREYKDIKHRYDQIIIDDKTSVITYLTSTNQKLFQDIEELKSKGKSLRELHSCYNYLNKKVFKRDGHLTRQLNKLALTILQSEVDKLCSEYSFKGTIDDNFNLNMSFQSRRDCTYAECSNGQKLVSNILMSCVLQNVFSRLYKLPHGILGLSVWDDIFSSVDPEYTSMIKDMLDKTVTRKYLVLTHNESLSELFSNHISVHLVSGEGNSSEYNFSWRPQLPQAI